MEIERLEGYDFKVSIRDGMEAFMMSEPAPLGTGEHPNGGHALGAALGHCMCSALIFCLEKARVEVNSLKAELWTKMERNEDGHMRLTRVRVKLYPTVNDVAKAKRCIDIYEDYCIVTQSIRQGIDVEAEVIPSEP